MSITDDTAPAAEIDNAEISPTSLSDILTSGDDGEGSDPAPAPAAAEPDPAPAPAAAAPTVDPAAKPEAEQPFWYRKEIEKERKARQAAEARAEAAERRPPPQQRQEPQGEPDDLDRPLTRRELAEYHDRQELIGRLQRSEERFIDKLGEETFESTREWLATRPDIEERALKQREPWKAAHSQFTKEKLAAEIGEDPNAWRAAEKERMRQELREEMEAEGRAPAPAPAPTMRRDAPPAAASTARSTGVERDAGGRFAGATPLSAALRR